MVSRGNLDFLGRRGHLDPLEEREAPDFLVSKAPEEKLAGLGYLENLVQPAQWVIEDHPGPLGLTDNKAPREHLEDQDYPDSKATQDCQEAEECKGIPAWPACRAWKDHQVCQVKKAPRGVPGPTVGLAPSAWQVRKATRALRADEDFQ